MRNNLKVILSFIASLLMVWTVGYAVAASVQCVTSGEKTSNTLIATGEVDIYGVTIFTNGSNTARVTLHDNTTASGAVIMPQVILPGAEGVAQLRWNPPIHAFNGAYLVISGTGASASVEKGF